LPFRDSETHLRDILSSIDHIDRFLSHMNFGAYRKDIKTESAVERQMQIISEAAIRLGGDAETLCPGPDWTGFRGMGNVLRHGYHRVDDKIVWDTIKDELPPMKAAIEQALRPHPLGPPDPAP
jgi:uncharacterized protein with HEPN domain